MIENKAVYPGSFDPITLGHIDIIERAIATFGSLTVAVVANPEKQSLFPLKERVGIIRDLFKDNPLIEVESFSGLLIDYMRSKKAKIVLRGLRFVSDFEYEFQMAITNKKMAPEVETYFMMAAESHSYLSSRLVKEVALLGGDISSFVPPSISERVFKKINKK